MAKASQVVILENEFYIIKAPNGKVLEVKDFNTENGAAIQLWSYAGHPWQQWQFVDAGGGRWRIQNRFTGKVMDLAMSGVVNGTWVHQWEKTTGKGQRWEIVPADGGKAKIRNVLADKVIDLVGMRVDNGTQAQIWQDVFGENQLWSIQPVPDKLLQKDMPKPESKKTAPKSTRTQTGTGRAKKTGGKGGRRAAK